MTGRRRGSRSVFHLCTVSESLLHIGPIARMLSEKGWDVHVGCAPGPEFELLGKQAPALSMHPVGFRRSISPAGDTRALGQLVRVMRRIRPSIVHAHTPKAGLLGMVVARVLGIPHRIYQIHGLRYEVAEGGLRPLLRTTERLACAAAHHVPCVSPSVRNQLVADGLVDAKKTLVFGHGSASGVDLNYFSPAGSTGAGQELKRELQIPTDAMCVGFAGRLARDKGLGWLQQVWPLVANAVPGAQLLLAGEPDETDPIDLSELQARGDVHFLRRLADMRPFFSALDVFVLPSFREGLGQVVLEASAMELAVVGARVTGLVDAIDEGVSGDFVPVGDREELCRVLVGLLANESRRTSLGRGGRAFVEQRFAQAPLLKRIANWYEELS